MIGCIFGLMTLELRSYSSKYLPAEFNKITIRTAIGFIVMGFIGFFVKLIFIVSLMS